MDLSKKKIKRYYDLSFKEDVIKMIASGRPVSELSKALGVAPTVLRRWYKASLPISPGSVPKGAQSPGVQNNAMEEIELLKSQLRRTEEERDILKKALGVFSRGI